MSVSTCSRSEHGEPVALDAVGFEGLVLAPAPESRSALEAELLRIVDPQAAMATVHWGRNYLYLAELSLGGEPVAVVVKAFRNQSPKARWRRRFGRSKARRSFDVSVAMRRAGLPVPHPVAVLESRRSGGPSYFVSRHVADAVEARHLFRALAASELEQRFPRIDFDRFLQALGGLLRRMHDAGFLHRDVSIGNVLITAPEVRGEAPGLVLLDLNRTRRRQRIGVWARMRDLCRLPLKERARQERLLASYWRGSVPAAARSAYRLATASFHGKLELKKRLRMPMDLLRRLRPRSTHVHIPPAREGATLRDRVVWDKLSDQPHQHAGRWAKARVRMQDAGSHLRGAGSVVRSLPGIRQRYARLQRELYRRPVAWSEPGIGIRPGSGEVEQQLAAIEELGVRRLLLRLHPWEDEWEEAVALARELVARDYDLSFVLPQNRDLVVDPQRWRAVVERFRDELLPYAPRVQIGQAINRSKWGVWTLEEYAGLLAAATDVLAPAGAELMGPAIIDFEFHATIATLEHLGAALCPDIVTSLLYVDRRGAPENAQMRFDSLDKILLLRSIIEGSPAAGRPSWITEFNWPLREGPHSPAGRHVSVDERTQAHYLVRFFVIALTSGALERAYWWRLVARGYGLIEPGETWRRRPSFRALAQLASSLRGSTSEGRQPSRPGTWVFRFSRQGEEIHVAWTVAGSDELRLSGGRATVVDCAGRVESAAAGSPVSLSPEPRFIVTERAAVT